MWCDYAILIMELSSYRNMITEYCESKFKWYITEIFRILYLGINNKNKEVEQKIIDSLDKRAYIMFYDNNSIYILCKCWDMKCTKCGRYDKVYNLHYYGRWCDECAYNLLLDKYKKNKIPSKEELINQLMS